MTEPRSKADKESGRLSKTCLELVHEWIKEQPEFYNRRVDFKSKYCDKGNIMEKKSIEFASYYYGWGMVEKNTEYKENDYLSGTADLILKESVEDIKNSWSQKTFPLFASEIPIDGYGWQLQGYCELYDKNKAGLIYTLMDAPESIIEKEAFFKAKELGFDETPLDLYEEVEKQMTYSGIPDELRINRFSLDRNKELMLSVQSKVQQIRDYIKSI